MLKFDAKDDVNEIGIENITVTESTQHSSFQKIIELHDYQCIIKAKNLKFSFILFLFQHFAGYDFETYDKDEVIFCTWYILEVESDIYVT